MNQQLVYYVNRSGLSLFVEIILNCLIPPTGFEQGVILKSFV